MTYLHKTVINIFLFFFFIMYKWLISALVAAGALQEDRTEWAAGYLDS